MVPGSVADQSGMIQAMDQIVAVNGQSICHLSKDQSLRLLRGPCEELHLTFLREMEPLPFDTESRLVQGDLEERKRVYREKMGDEYEVGDCVVFVQHLFQMVSEMQDQDGTLKYK